MNKSNRLDGYEERSDKAWRKKIENQHGDFREPNLTFHHIKKDSPVTTPQKYIYIYDRSSQFDLLEQVEGTYLWVSPMPKDILNKHHLITRKCSLATPTIDMIIYPHKDSLDTPELDLIDALRSTLNSLTLSQ